MNNGKEKKDLKLVGEVMDMTTGEIRSGDIRRIDHRDKILEGLEKSKKRADRIERNWERSKIVWRYSFISLVVAAFFGTLFTLMVTSNRLYATGKVSLHIDNTILTVCGVIMAVFAVATVVQMILARILERG